MEDELESKQPPVEEVLLDEDFGTKPEVVAEAPVSTEAKKCKVFTPMSLGVTIKGIESIDLPSYRRTEIARKIGDMPNVDQFTTDEGRKWAQGVINSATLIPSDDMFNKTLDGADFTSRPNHGGHDLIPGSPVTRANSKTMELTGEAAVISMVSHLGLGELRQIPLWHSGFWVMFKPPSNNELINLHHLLIDDDIQMGRHTYGIAYSSTSCYTVARILQFAIDHVYSTTVKAEELTSANMLEHIDPRDIYVFIWGMLCSMYPKGFNYSRYCIDDTEKCKHEETGLLDLQELQRVNFDVLTDWQRAHMSARSPRSQELAAIKRYKEELKLSLAESVVFGQDTEHEFTINLRVPTAKDYIEAGYRWLSDLTESVEKALGTDAILGRRNDMYYRHALASSMRQFSHFVDGISFSNKLIKDKASIERTLTNLSSDTEIRDMFVDKIKGYIDRSTMAVIGIPNYDCPVCGKNQQNEDPFPRLEEIIPLDMVQLFFDLLSQRVQRLAAL